MARFHGGLGLGEGLRAVAGLRPALAGSWPSAEPGVIRLKALRERGQVVDFSWEFADATAARQLRCTSRTPGGERPIDSIARVLGDRALFLRYRQALEAGEAQVFVLPLRSRGDSRPATSTDDVLHRVVCQGDGVTVTLTNLSADRRTQARRLGNRVQAGRGGHDRAVKRLPRD